MVEFEKKAGIPFSMNILVSGKGSTLDNLAYHCLVESEGMLYSMVAINQVTADRECPALDVADKWGIPARVVLRSDYTTNEEWSEAIFEGDSSLHVMAGFLSKVTVPQCFEGRVVNIHPSLLPAYGGKGMYGMNVHKAVIDNKEKFTGCTVHVVDNELDHGPILEQFKQAVLPWDTPESLCDAVQSIERLLYPRAILNYLLKNRRKS